MTMAQPCLTCRHRAWKSVAGFMVLHCRLHQLRFGSQPDLKRRRVNKAGRCVAMPWQCKEFDRSG